MDWVSALAAGLALLAAATATGFVWRSRQGVAHAARPETVSARELGTPALGERATLLQFSTEFCAQCPATARLLGGLAGERPGVEHVEIDLTRRAELADRFRIAQTPTTLVLDGAGTVLARIGGTPRRDDIIERLDRTLRSHRVNTIR